MPNNWALPFINKISSVTSPYSGARVMGGDAKGRFSPKGPFTTEQAIATMLRMFESVVGEKAGYSGGVIASEEPQPAARIRTIMRPMITAAAHPMCGRKTRTTALQGTPPTA